MRSNVNYVYGNINFREEQRSFITKDNKKIGKIYVYGDFVARGLCTEFLLLLIFIVIIILFITIINRYYYY